MRLTFHRGLLPPDGRGAERKCQNPGSRIPAMQVFWWARRARAWRPGVMVAIVALDAYGESEVAVGKALRGRRDGVVLTTKFSRPIGDDPNHQGASRRWIMTTVENSLRRLQTDEIVPPGADVGTLDQA
jgi:hypothetical protein